MTQHLQSCAYNSERGTLAEENGGKSYHEQVAHRYDDAQRHIEDHVDGYVLGVQEVLQWTTWVASILDVHQLNGPSLDYGVDGLRDQQHCDVTE